MEEISELIQKGYNDILEQRLKAMPSLADIKTPQGISLLQYAAYCRNTVAIDMLKKYKQCPDIFEAASIGDYETVSLLLEQDPGLINSFSSDGFTVLGLASFFGHLALVNLFLTKGANPNTPSNNQLKVAPIHSASAISSNEIVELLILHGADVNAKQMQDVTPLHSAAHNGQTRLCKLLIDHGANVNAKMLNGKTPLSMALEKEYQETANLIISLGGQ